MSERVTAASFVEGDKDEERREFFLEREIERESRGQREEFVFFHFVPSF